MIKFKIAFVIFLLVPVLTNADEKDQPTDLHVGQFGFIENKGQITDPQGHPNPGVKYLLCRPGFNIQLTQKGFSYDTYNEETVGGFNKENWSSYSDKGLTDKKVPVTTRNYHRVDVELLHCNPDHGVQALDASTTYLNYFTAGTPEGGVSNVHFYQKVIYQNIYKNIDLEFFVVSQKKNDKPAQLPGFEYDFIVHPGGNINDIQLCYKGAYKTGLDRNGELNIKVASGTFIESIPSSYLKGSNNVIEVKYIFLGENSYGFRTRTNTFIKFDLVIDPTPSLTWATYYNGTVASSANGIVIDGSGNSYVTGGATSTTNIATAGVYQTTYAGGGNDVFISKFNSTGTALTWGTYYGGSGYDIGNQIDLDGSGNIIVVGNTQSTSAIATAGAYQTAIGDGTGNAPDAFIAKFNSTGTTLTWATYYGGTSSEIGYDFKLDGSGNIYITGQTRSTTAVATAGVYQTAYGGGDDVFVAKFNSTGTALTWATYYGGTGSESAAEIAIDGSSNVYVTGTTASTTAIATAGAYQTALGGGGQDAFVAKFNSTGTALTWGSYYGGTGSEIFSGIAVDGSNNVYITGYTSSTSAIATAGAYQTTYGKGTNDGYMAKFNSTGTALAWATYYGASGLDRITDIALDAGNNVFITGITASTDSIATPGAYQTVNAGGGDAFVAKINSAGTRLSWGTYYGGTSQESPQALVVDASDNVYVAGYTFSSGGIATAGAYQTAYTGSPAVFVAKFGDFISGLPIELLHFNAVPLNDYVQLNWVTATETNNDYFTVERAADGKTFEELTKIRGAGNSCQTLTYETKDFRPLIGQSYYRLRQTDYDGQYTYSNIVAVSFIPMQEGKRDTFTVYPNPASSNEQPWIVLTADENQQVLIVVYDIRGKEYYSKVELVQCSGENIFAIDLLQKLACGVYYVTATSNNKIHGKKLMIE